MPALATADEAQRGHFLLLARVGMLEPLLAAGGVELRPLDHQPPSRVRGLTCSGRLDHLADEPFGEDRRLHAFWRLAWSPRIDRRRAQREGFPVLQPAFGRQLVAQTLHQPWLGNRLPGAGSMHLPAFQAADHDRAHRQIDHGAGAEGRNQLADALDWALHGTSCALTIFWPSGPRIFSTTLGSTSRIERLATKCR